MVNPVIAVPIYGVCSEGYIKHSGYPVLDESGRPVPVVKGWSGLVDDPDGSGGLILFCAFLPTRVTGGQVVPLGKTFAENLGQAACVLCSFPPVYPKIEFFRARLMRVVSDTALRADVIFPPWVMRRALGSDNRAGRNIILY
jgi:hypothetical protein